MDPLYKPQGVEQRWQQTWEEEGLYGADPDAPGETFVVMHPPPNISGSLTIGHCLQLSLEDTLVRWHRMRGFNTLFQPGYDHAGISTLGVDRAARSRRRGRASATSAARLRRVRPGVARALRRHDHEPVPAARRLARLPAHALHDGRGLLPRGHALVRPPLRARLDLPREPDRQLVPARQDGALGPRGRARGRRRHALVHPAIRSPTAPATSRSRRCGRRRSSPTSRSRSIPTTSATASSSARRSSSPSSSGACP